MLNRILLTIYLISIVFFMSCESESGSEEKDDIKVSIEIDTAASGLVIPWDIDFAGDGRIFITERPGRIRVISEGELLDTPWAELPVANWRAAGLSGLALSPDFDNDGFLYVMGTFRAGENKFINRIYRFTDVGTRGIDPMIVIDSLPSIDTHAGGGLDFGPDGKLYVAMGDNENISLVQETDNTTGKILRYNPDGSIPEDNPFSGSPVYALGVRNNQGFAWDPVTGKMFSTEHGPSGFPAEGYREHQDELNLIRKGGNYGWPIVSGMHMDERFIKPLVEWTPAIAPSGLGIVTNKQSPWYRSLLIGALRGQHLRRIILEQTDDTIKVTNEEVLFEKEFGRIRFVEEGPDGKIYFSTGNIDTPGEPRRQLSRPGDDHVYQLIVNYE